MRTTITLDDEVYEAALAHARATGKRLGEALSDMARRSLAPPAPTGGTARPTDRFTGRFPVFVVPPGTPPLPASRVQQALDEEGIV